MPMAYMCVWFIVELYLCYHAMRIDFVKHGFVSLVNQYFLGPDSFIKIKATRCAHYVLEDASGVDDFNRLH